MKKLLIMASLFWPQKKSGGPPVSILNLAMSVRDKFEISIISKNHEINDDKPLEGIASGWNSFEFGKAYYTPKGEHSFKQVYALIEEVKPDVIYQNSFFSIDDLLPVLIYKLKHKQVKVIVAPRGEFYPERIQVGKAKKMIYSKLFMLSGLLHDVYFQGTGEEECKQEMELLDIPEGHIYNIQNLSVIADLDRKELLKDKGSARLVYIARVHPTKNTLKAIEWLTQVNGCIEYDIYGSIEDKEYWARCEEVIAKLPADKTVRYMGVIEHDAVAQVLSSYHAYYMPTTGENFGHSIVESMLLGRPVIISDQTPWTTVNTHGGFSVELKNESGFVKAIQTLCDMGQTEYDVRCEKVREYINKELNTAKIVQDYVDAFDSEV